MRVEPLPTVAGSIDCSARGPSIAFVLGAWLVAGVALLVFLGDNAVQRTQEARVAEVARQMLGRPAYDWLVPKLNGEVRLQKPPLTYWLSALSYKLGGVSEFTARAPAAIVGWLTLALAYAIGTRLFGRRAGLLGGATLLSSFLFFRHMRLAETDAPATLGVTLSIYALLRGFGLGRSDREHEAGGSAIWFHVAAAGIALAAFGKGLPGLFPILFLVAWVIAERRWDVLWRVVRCGAPLTTIVLALPWYVYVGSAEGWKTLFHELNAVTAGEDHPGWFFSYFPQLFIATAPWCGLMPFAIFEAARRWRPDGRMRTMILWLLAVFIPLCFAGNKQMHYLLSLMPPVMILVGWMIDAGTRPDAPPSFARGTKLLLACTIAGSMLAGVGLLIGARVELGRITRADIAMAVVILGLCGAVWSLWRRGITVTALGLSLAWAGIFPVLLGLYFPRFEPTDVRVVANAVRQNFGTGPYVFYGGDRSLPLCFALRREIRSVQKPGELIRLGQTTPNLVVIAQNKTGATPIVPKPFKRVMILKNVEQTYDFYRMRE